jgi:endonuclease YncB( thermonuclease family)
LTLVLFAALTLGACAPTETGPGPTTFHATGTITAVIDGDTIEVDTSDGQLDIRLVATNAPEKGECYSDEARQHLAGAEGSTTTLEIVGVDQFDRTLAHVFVGERHLNLEMVVNGLAIASTPAGGDVYGDEILAAEQAAYDRRLGLWNATACGASEQPASVAIDPTGSFPDPGGPDEDDLDGETIRLVNSGTVDIDLSSWVLRDESSRNRYTFPNGVVLRPGARITVTSADAGWSPGGGPVWNNDGDMALLQDGLGTVVARWRY